MTTSIPNSAASIYMSADLVTAARRLVNAMGRCSAQHPPRRRRMQGWAVEVITPHTGSERTRLVATGKCPACSSTASRAEAL